MFVVIIEGAVVSSPSDQQVDPYLIEILVATAIPTNGK